MAPAEQTATPQGVPDTISIVGTDIDRVLIRSPQNEVLLLCFAAG